MFTYNLNARATDYIRAHSYHSLVFTRCELEGYTESFPRMAFVHVCILHCRLLCVRAPVCQPYTSSACLISYIPVWLRLQTTSITIPGLLRMGNQLQEPTMVAGAVAAVSDKLPINGDGRGTSKDTVHGRRSK